MCLKSIRKLNIEWPYDPPIPFLGVYTREIKKSLHMNVHHSIICNSQGLNQSVEWCIHAMEYYSVTNRNEVLIYAVNINESWKKPDMKEQILYDSIYITYSE
jgi:hypothetical protein